LRPCVDGNPPRPAPSSHLPASIINAPDLARTTTLDATDRLGHADASFVESLRAQHERQCNILLASLAECTVTGTLAAYVLEALLGFLAVLVALLVMYVPMARERRHPFPEDAERSVVSVLR
jgi:hypothetical protein